MKALCLPKRKADAVTRALKSEDISIDSLYKMDSTGRQTIFKQYVGEDLAPTLNAKFEQAMLSKQKDSMANWVKQVTKPKSPARRDMLKRVEGLEKALEGDGAKELAAKRAEMREGEEVLEEAERKSLDFLSDLAEMKLGINVTEQEASLLLKMSKTLRAARKDVLDNESPQRQEVINKYLARNEGGKISETPDEVLRFAIAQENFVNYSRELITKAEQPDLVQYAKYQQFDAVVDGANALKSAAASLDVSFMGRQGINILLKGHVRTWARGMQNNLQIFGETLFEKSPGFSKERDNRKFRATMVDIFREPNYINGKYTAARDGYGMGITKEEAFPSSLPGRVPILGRFFHASENAFNTTALVLRKELANKWIKYIEDQGGDVYDPDNANQLSRMVLSSTGRGPLGKLGVFGKELNALFFSVRYWSALIDTMTMGQIGVQPAITRKLAAREGIKMYANLAALYGIYYAINPESVQWLDEGGARSSDFGRLKLTENIQIDPTGGMLAHVRVMAQLITGWKYNGKDYIWSDIKNPDFGEDSSSESFLDYITGKASPFTRALGEWYTGEKFGGEETNMFWAFVEAGSPITGELVIEEMRKGNSDAMAAIILESFGFSPYPTVMGGYGDKWLQIKEQTEPDEFYGLTKEYTERYQERATSLKNSRQWESLSEEDRKKELKKIKTQEANRIYKRYGVE